MPDCGRPSATSPIWPRAPRIHTRRSRTSARVRQAFSQKSAWCPRRIHTGSATPATATAAFVIQPHHPPAEPHPGRAFCCAICGQTFGGGEAPGPPEEAASRLAGPGRRRPEGGPGVVHTVPSAAVGAGVARWGRTARWEEVPRCNQESTCRQGFPASCSCLLKVRSDYLPWKSSNSSSTP